MLQEYKQLLTNREKDVKYKRVDILSTQDYIASMQQPCNTFNAGAPEPVMSAQVRFAINYLASQKMYKVFTANDITILNDNPLWGTEEVIARLRIHEKKKPTEGGGYY